MTHTPGPWHVKNGIVYTTGGSGIMSNPPLKVGSGWIEDAWCDENADEESTANAHLIAAAPELLEACEEMENMLRHDERTYVKEMVIRVNSAIAKARNTPALHVKVL